MKVKCGSVIERLDHEARSIFTLGLLIRIYFFGNLIKIGCFLSMVNRFFQCPMQQTCLDFDLPLDHFEMFFLREGHCIALPWLVWPNQDDVMSVLTRL